MEEALDAGYGEAFLATDAVGPLIERSLFYFDGERYRLHAWCVMPNHVHVLVTPMPDRSLSSILHSWKSFSAKQVNAVLGRTGKVWFEEYFDRKIRDERHFEDARFYIEQHPARAGLCPNGNDWPCSSGSHD